MGITDVSARRRCIDLALLWPAFMRYKWVEGIDGRLKIIVMESEVALSGDLSRRGIEVLRGQ